MKELDLDELDQAVNKLMVDAGKPKPKKEAPKEAVAPTTPPAEPVTPAAEPAAAPAPAPSPTPEPKEEEQDDKVAVSVTSSQTAAAQITPRKKGVAMDIVRPQATAVTPPSARAARTAPTLQPTKPVEPEKPEAPKEEAPKEEPAPPEPEKKEDEQQLSDDAQAAIDMLDKNDKPEEPDTEVHKSAWPDPLDVHGFKEHPDHNGETTSDEKESHPTMEHHTVLAPVADKDEPKEDNAAETTESATPFVTTKVEKRPLGAYADKVSEEAKEEAQEQEQEKEEPAEAEEAPKTEQATVPVQEAPKELSAEVVAVESAEPEFVSPAQAKAEEKEENDMNNLRQMSIPQQYKAEEKAPSKDARPVFDTKEYHPPLQIPATAHHKSHAGTVFTVILILLIVAAAVVAYFIATGGIDLARLL